MIMAAARKSFLFSGGVAERVNPRNMIISSEAEFDFDESDVWDSNDQAKISMMNNNSRPLRKPMRKMSSININVSQRSISAATSLPVNVPDWSSILGDEYKSHRRESKDEVNEDEDDDDEEEFGRLPPHEYLARTRGSSFSVHEGIGRTLKGRDLSRVRNAVWKQTGFED